jgi:hypothetical protein
MLPLGVLTAATASPAAHRADRAVHYLGYSFEVPRSWRVVRLDQHRHACVRFDRHAVYLGTPSPNQSCPSSVVGTTEAMLIEPGPRHAAAASAENLVTRRITVTGRRLRIMATFGSRTGEITKILASAGLPAPTVAPDAEPAAGSPAMAWNAEPQPAVTVPALPPSITNYQGLGFDTCAAPSEAVMKSWGASPYRAVGIYLGGSDAACAQPNLTASWVKDEAAAGWHFMPMYVGPQAAFGELTSSSASQGAAAAKDAVHQARQLGFGTLTPIYYDMEAYPPWERGRALGFESAWTTTLHALGYDSGVYSSSSSGIADLVHEYGRGRYTMPDVIFDALWNGQATTYDPVFGNGEWRPHQRLHQYLGNVTRSYGGVTMQIDLDYLNVLLSTPAGTPAAAPAVTQPDGTQDVFYRGTDDGLWYVQRTPGKSWSRAADLGGSLYSEPTAVVLPTGGTVVFYHGTDGLLWLVSSKPGGWSAAQPVPALGILGGRPWAVSEPSGTIDVFWRNYPSSSLWSASYTAAGGWSSPQQLAVGLDSAPSPTVSSPGVVEVFWKGQDGNLWQVSRDQAGSWGSPASLGMGPLGGWPHATAQPDGEAEVFWRHGTELLGAFLTADGGWTGPVSLGGGLSAAPPAPVSSEGLVHVLFVGSDHGLWQSLRTTAGQWLGPLPLLPGPLLWAPFAATETGQPQIDVFWKSADHQLWWASVSAAGHASAPADIAGQVG